MGDEREITTEDVLAVSPTPRRTAERIAEYANLRAGGLVPTDAYIRVGVDQSTGGRYEHWTAAIRQHLGLAPLDKQRGWSAWTHERKVQASQSGVHTRYHVQRGVTSPDCPHCTPEVVSES